MNTGDLVRFKKKSPEAYSKKYLGSSSPGLVLSEPEMFGFIQRVHVMWPGGSSEGIYLEEWVDMEDLVIVSQG